MKRTECVEHANKLVEWMRSEFAAIQPKEQRRIIGRAYSLIMKKSK